MTDVLLATKLLRPRLRPDRVRRARLAALLARAADAPVTVVSAPAGFGKTTAVTAWLAELDRPAAWVSLDSRDRRPASFWSYLFAALDRSVPGSAAAALTRWQSGQVPVETVLAAVINELSVHDGEVALVLDDYHLADGPDVAAGMSFLVDNLPPQLHLVLSTRADPGLPLSRLRARGDLAEVRAADLRFDAAEVTAYLNDVNGLELPGAAVAALEARTEGWVAALQLAVLSLRDRADAADFIQRFAGDDRYVVDYLVDEVLDRQPTDVRRFLLDTSVLGRLTAPLCDALRAGTDAAEGASAHAVGSRNGRAMLDLLDRQNLFLVPLDDHRRWYRYHHLFAEVLHAHLVAERPADVDDLHRRASRWWAENGDVEEAVGHALSAGDADAAADLIELALHDLRRQRRERLLRRWADEIPEDVLRHRPVLALGLVGGLMASNDFGDVDRRLRQVEETLAQPHSSRIAADPAALARAPAEVEMYRAGLALVSGDAASTTARAALAAAAAPAGDDLTPASAAALTGLAAWAGGDIVTAHTRYLEAAAGLSRAGFVADTLGCTLAIADMELALGRLRDVQRTIEQGLELADRHRPGPGVSLRGTADMLVALARTAWHRDDLATAADLLRRADDLGEAAALPQNPYRWRVAMARLRAAERDWSAALDLLDEAERLYITDFSPPVHPIHASRARILIASGDLTSAVQWARTHDVRADDDLTYLREYEHVTLARLLVAQHRAGHRTALTASQPSNGTVPLVPLPEVTALLDRLLAAAEAGGRVGTVIEVEVLRAAIHRAAGERGAALEALEHAVDLAEPEDWRRFLVDAAPTLADLLEEVARRRPSTDHLQALLAGSRPATRTPAAGTPATAPAPSSARAPAAHAPAPARVRGATPEWTSGAPLSLADPLSERELDVLRLLGSDLDGPAIARELVVSLNTVRTHTKHIYSKLGVNSRRAAISKAHQLGLLAGARSR